MSTGNIRSDKLTPFEQKLEELESGGGLHNNEHDETEEVMSFLLFTIRLATKKMKSHKIPDTTKVKFLKVAVDSSKALLFSGILDKKSRRQISGYEAFFLSVFNKRSDDSKELSDDEMRSAIE